jgi:putative hemin transport protein
LNIAIATESHLHKDENMTGVATAAATARPLRPIEAAAALGLSEGEWLTRRAPADLDVRLTRLNAPAAAILQALTPLGTVMALTRNPACVHEKDGVYDQIDINPGMGLVTNHDIDLRLFMRHWDSAFAVETPQPDGSIRHSLQFFDKHGTAIHKIFARPVTDMAAWGALVARFAGDFAAISAEPLPLPAAVRPDAEIDVAALREGWSQLKDVHDFFGLLRTLKAHRQQALRLAGAPYARRIAADAIRTLLADCAACAIPIMCFVGNDAIIQIHSGTIRNVKVMGPWLNVLDQGFNLHLREDMIAAVYAVWKPQRDAAVHSIELFADDGSLIAQFFGERKPGRPEIAAWAQAVQAVPGL